MKGRGSIILRALAAIGLISSFVFGEAEAVDRGLKIAVKNSAGITNKIDLYSGYHALVIGIGNYKSPWSSLPGAVKDAREVAEKFQSIGWDTTLLENPTGNELKRSFNRLIAGPGRDSQKAILVWFSGHGHTLKQFDGTPSGYLVPSDAPDPDLDEVGFRGTAMDMASIEQISKSILSKHVLMVFDSCFSGSLFTVSRSLKPSPYIQMKTLKPVRQFITAGQDDEKVPDDSIFQKVFLQGLSDRYADLNRDGYVTGEELGSYLQEKVINYSNSTQHPQYAKINHHLLDKGDFVFVLPNAGLSDVPDRRARELELWVNIRDSDDPKVFEDFLERFPDGIYAGLAELRLKKLLEPKQTRDRHRRIEQLLTRASNAFENNQFVEPQGDNALTLYRAALNLDPNNQRARNGIGSISEHFLRQARRELAAGEYAIAEQNLRIAAAIEPQNQTVLQLQQQLQKRRQLAEKRQRLQAEAAAKNAEADNLASQQELLDLQNGLTAYYEGSYSEAYRFLAPLAAQGDPRAQVRVANMLIKARGVQRDEEEAMRLFSIALQPVQLSASDGRAWAQSDLGDYFHDGWVIDKNYRNAVYWYRRAAEQGYAPAQNILGWLYMHGHGVSPDEEMAIKWFRRAAEQGDVTALDNLKVLGKVSVDSGELNSDYSGNEVKHQEISVASTKPSEKKRKAEAEKKRKKEAEKKRKAEAEKKRKKVAEKKRKAEEAREQEKQDAYSALRSLSGAIRGKIEENWSNIRACSGQEVIISVKVDIKGKVNDVKVIGDSGDEQCRRSAVNAVYKASPLPFPDNPRFYKWLDEEFQIIFKADI